MARRKLLPHEKGEQVYIYPPKIHVTTLSRELCGRIAVTAIKREYTKLQKETARLSKEAQQNAMEKSAERVNDNQL